MSGSNRSSALAQANKKLLHLALFSAAIVIFIAGLFFYSYNQWRLVASSASTNLNIATSQSLFVQRLQLLNTTLQATDKATVITTNKKLEKNLRRISVLESDNNLVFSQLKSEQSTLDDTLGALDDVDFEKLDTRRKMAQGQVQRVVDALDSLVAENGKQEVELYQRILANSDSYTATMLVNTYANTVTDQEKLEQLLIHFSDARILLTTLSMQTPLANIDQSIKDLSSANLLWQKFYAIQDEQNFAEADNAIKIFIEIALTEQKMLQHWQELLQAFVPVLNAISIQKDIVEKQLIPQVDDKVNINEFIPLWATDTLADAGVKVKSQHIVWALLGVVFVALMVFFLKVSRLRRSITEYAQTDNARDSVADSVAASVAESVAKSAADTLKPEEDQNTVMANENFANEVAEQELRLKQRSKEIADQEQQLAQRSDKITEQEQQLTLRSDEMTKQEQQLTQRNDEITEQEQRLTQRRDEITEQKQLLTQRSDEITEREQQLAQRSDEISEQERQTKQQTAETESQREKSNITSDKAIGKPKAPIANKPNKKSGRQVNGNRVMDLAGYAQNQGSIDLAVHMLDDYLRQLDAAKQALMLAEQKNDRAEMLEKSKHIAKIGAIMSARPLYQHVSVLIKTLEKDISLDVSKILLGVAEQCQNLAYYCENELEM